MTDRIALPPLAIYLHYPWCLKKCPYCDFNSHAVAEQPLIDRYLAAVQREIADLAHRHADRQIESIFFGGGTPSLLSGAAVTTILTTLRHHFSLSSDCEITLEANPGTIDQGHFSAYHAAGVNRLSIGIQSFDDRALQQIGRIHTSRQGWQAIELAHKVGFASINLDLMFALPGQDLAAAMADLRHAMAQTPHHLSWYHLTCEANTPFGHTPPANLPDEEIAWAIQDEGLALLASHGFARYEVSAFARSGYACRHNRNYWQFGDYLGIGSGAHGKITTPQGERYRSHHPRHPNDYIRQISSGAGATCSAIPATQLPFEFALNALRMTAGFSLTLFQQRTGLPAAILSPILASLVERRLIDWHGDQITPTPLGFDHLNTLVEAFLPP
jgi:putative oxygen-independent coproporphyrinogen III oxidase